jgi:dynein heavy chain
LSAACCLHCLHCLHCLLPAGWPAADWSHVSRLVLQDDLLEILGQARDPKAVQPHVRKCFEAIKTLDMKESGKEGRKVLEAVGFKSPEGEYVKMEDSYKVTCAGAVEKWLVEVETGMCGTLAKDMFRCFQDMKK